MSETKKINPAKYLRQGGEQLLIQTAKRNKFTLKKNKNTILIMPTLDGLKDDSTI